MEMTIPQKTVISDRLVNAILSLRRVEVTTCDGRLLTRLIPDHEILLLSGMTDNDKLLEKFGYTPILRFQSSGLLYPRIFNEVDPLYKLEPTHAVGSNFTMFTFLWMPGDRSGSSCPVAPAMAP